MPAIAKSDFLTCLLGEVEIEEGAIIGTGTLVTRMCHDSSFALAIQYGSFASFGKPEIRQYAALLDRNRFPVCFGAQILIHLVVDRVA